MDYSKNFDINFKPCLQDGTALKANMEGTSSPNPSRLSSSESSSHSHHPQQILQQQQSSIQGPKREREAPPYRAPPPGPAANVAATGSPGQAPRSLQLPLPLPPYRDPPPPTQSPVRPSPSQPTPPASQPTSASKPRRNILKVHLNKNINVCQSFFSLYSFVISVLFLPVCVQDFPVSETDSHQEAVLYNAQYRELVRLVNYQREKLSSQQAELTKVSAWNFNNKTQLKSQLCFSHIIFWNFQFDAEIVFWEGKSHEQKRQIELIAQETVRMEAQSRQSEEQVSLFQFIWNLNQPSMREMFVQHLYYWYRLELWVTWRKSVSWCGSKRRL